MTGAVALLMAAALGRGGTPGTCTCGPSAPTSAEQGPAPRTEPPGPEPGLEPQAKIAARLDRDGEAMLADKQFAGASAAFRDAVARVPEPLYFYDLARSLDGEGKYTEAYTACDAARNASAPGSPLRAQADALAAQILHEASQLE